MKRLLLVSFAGLLLNVHVFAQYDYGDYDDDEEAGASDTINFSATNSGEEGHSVQKLTLPNNQPIYLYFYNTVQNPEPPQAPPPPEPVQQVPLAEYYPRTPEPIVEYRYVPGPSTPPPPEPPIYIQSPPKIEYVYIQPPAPQVEYVYIQPPAPQVEYVYLPPPPPQVEYIPPPQVEYLPPPPPQVEYIPPPPPRVEYIPPPRVEPVYIQQPAQIRVIPGLPNPNSSKVYRLQVGTYTAHNTAEKAAQRVMSAGLHAGIESYNSLKRVVVPSVRAADVCSVVQMLEMLGFQEVWIRE
jgi:hypothetical protein